MNKVSELKQHIKTLQDEVVSIQEDCSHDRIVYKYGSNTGNYDPSCDSYWVDIECLCCDKKFHIDSDLEPYYYKRFQDYYGKILCVSEEDYKVLSTSKEKQ